MKKILLVFITIILIFSSCKKDNVEFIFDKQPEARVKEKLDLLQNSLLSSPYGWKAALNTKVEGGYGFYIDFKKDQTLKMLSDFSSTSSNTLKESTYRVTWTMDAVLMFDTYNYLTLLQDPTPSVNGGTAGNGLQSDIEFEFLSASVDTLKLKGKRYAQMLTLVKLKENEQKSYLDGEYKTSINNVRAYFASHSNNYIEIGGTNNKVEFVLTNTKGCVFQYVSNEGDVQSVSGKFNYELNGINFNEPINVGQEIFARGELVDGEFYLINDKNTRFKLNQNSVPILPIETLFAYNKTYNTLHIGLSQPNGVTSDFNSIYTIVKNAYAALNPGRHILQFYFRLSSSTKAEVAVQSQVTPNGTTYAAGIATYDYKLDEKGVITLSNPIYDGNWTARITQLGPIRDYFLSGPFKLTYVTSSDPSVSNLGGLQPLNTPNNVFYGALRKQ
ncbi:DUF4302 domain-containing protein [Sphingobacterium sp. BIGb0165]|uniref:DUF4302 domain-containing protein n=1 Tax=Sphingobacterium sp. BIGb0165 TaxID=2940615 RepID=UPI00216A834E|nr:DUF4302 domain-containing protein [Sphingobacterium sp. BIGb0165]MCS4225155.1 hypothetical protein [Sphingobacterium sp. BIGb0165]